MMVEKKFDLLSCQINLFVGCSILSLFDQGSAFCSNMLHKVRKSKQL